jgi:hypothetical protein
MPLLSIKYPYLRDLHTMEESEKKTWPAWWTSQCTVKTCDGYKSKEQSIVRELDKTRSNATIFWSQVQSDRERDTANEKSAFKKSGRRAAQRKETGVARKEARSYDIMAIQQQTSNTERGGTADETAADEYE